MPYLSTISCAPTPNRAARIAGRGVSSFTPRPASLFGLLGAYPRKPMPARSRPDSLRAVRFSVSRLTIPTVIQKTLRGCLIAPRSFLSMPACNSAGTPFAVDKGSNHTPDSRLNWFLRLGGLSGSYSLASSCWRN